GWLEKELKQGDEAKWLATLLKIAGPEDKEGQAVVKATVQAASPLSDAWKAKLVEDLGGYYDALLKLLELPQDQFLAQAPPLYQQFKASNPVAGLFVPRLDAAYERDYQARAQRVMFRAAIGIALDGPDKVKEFQNAAGQTPFEYHALPNGFE